MLIAKGFSMHRTTLGDFELTVVSDGTYFLDGGAFFGVVPKTMWSKKIAPDEQNRLDAGLNSLLVRTGEKNILIETASATNCLTAWSRSSNSRPSCSTTCTPQESRRKTSTSSSIRTCILTTAVGTRC